MARKMYRNVEKRGGQAARNGPSEDRKWWQRVELDIYCLIAGTATGLEKSEKHGIQAAFKVTKAEGATHFRAPRKRRWRLFSAMTSPDPIVQRLLAGSNVFPFVFHIGRPPITSTHPFHSAGRRFIMPV